MGSWKRRETSGKFSIASVLPGEQKRGRQTFHRRIQCHAALEREKKKGASSMIDSFFDCDFFSRRATYQTTRPDTFPSTKPCISSFCFHPSHMSFFFLFFFAHGRLGHGHNRGFLLERATGNGFVWFLF